NDAHGGLSTTGSMLEPAAYAIDFARERGLPLVINMSFGVGNEIEGTARIDMIVDSILSVHPDLVWVISAGNEGPGLSTVGFPGSARNALTVGAIMPAAFLQGGTKAPGEPIAFFSGRGGELAKPEIVTPGVAYSTVPAWNVGEEQSSGTSMAAPHASGLVALLRSGLVQEGREADADEIRRALMVTARPVADERFLEQGSGIPDIGAAWQWLSQSHQVPDISVNPAGGSVTDAAFRSGGLRGPGDTSQVFEIRRPAGAGTATYRLESSATWLSAPASVTLADTLTRVTLRYASDALIQPGVYSGTVSAWGSDSLTGPVFRLVNTVIVPAGDSMAMDPLPIPAGGQRRFFFPADSGRPFTAIARSGESEHQILVFLHEPGGMPLSGGTPLAVPFGQDAAFH
ncbi:MAG: S8 family serine peptidase, partial [Gemmatimonadales bacterium]